MKNESLFPYNFQQVVRLDIKIVIVEWYWIYITKSILNVIKDKCKDIEKCKYIGKAGCDHSCYFSFF